MNYNTVGLSLGGGSALGFAHIGVLKLFEEENIRFDVLAGCSMGSLIGGIYASGCPLSKLDAMARVFNDRHYIDIASPVKSDGYLKGDKVEKLVEIMTEGIAIEQTKLPFACLASCLEDATARFFTSGPLYKAIRASISIPGVFDPVTENGKTLVDGGVMDRSGLSALELLRPDFRILCDVDFHGGTQPTPNNAREVVAESYNILAWHAVRPHLETADIIIMPDLSEFTGRSFNDIDPIIARGYDAARTALPELKEKLGL